MSSNKRTDGEPSARQVARSLPVVPGKSIRVPVEVALAYMQINDLEFVGVPSCGYGVVRRKKAVAEAERFPTVVNSGGER